MKLCKMHMIHPKNNQKKHNPVDVFLTVHHELTIY